MKTILLLSLSVLALLSFHSCKPIDIPVVGDISGIVTDADTGEPIQGATVNLSPQNTSMTTGADGKYSFLELDPKDYTIEVQKNDFVTNTLTITVSAGKTNYGDIALQKIIPILHLSVSSLDFGNNLTSLPVAITNTGEGVLSWNVSETANWISVNPISGTTASETSNIMVNIDRSNLSTGSHSQTISIISNGGNSTITITAIK